MVSRQTTFFISVNLCNELKEKHTSLVGTINRNRRDFLDVKKSWLIKQCTTLKFCDLNLVAHATLYKAKKSKTVCLICSLHRTVQFSADENKTKVGVDCIDQMSVKFYTRRLLQGDGQLPFFQCFRPCRYQFLDPFPKSVEQHDKSIAVSCGSRKKLTSFKPSQSAPVNECESCSVALVFFSINVCSVRGTEAFAAVPSSVASTRYMLHVNHVCLKHVFFLVKMLIACFNFCERNLLLVN